MLGRAAAAEFDVPGERRRSHTCVERRRRCVSEPREHVDAAGRRDQHQRVVPERQVMAAIVEDVERDLGRRRGSMLTFQLPVTVKTGTRLPSQKKVPPVSAPWYVCACPAADEVAEVTRMESAATM